MTLFRNKYRVESIRRPGWDYSVPGFYFTTICTHEMRMYFGAVVNGEMKLSTLGKVAEEHWKAIPNHFEKVTLDEFIVMPNHIHGVIKLSGECDPKLQRNGVKRTLADVSPKSGSLSHIMRCCKGGVTRWCKEQDLGFAWHSGFHDRIVLGPRSLEAIRKYIRDNPAKWDKDTQNPAKSKIKSKKG